MTAQPATTTFRNQPIPGAPHGRTAPPAAISFHGLTRRFGTTVALDHVSLEIPLGSTVALLGPNGAGKSTAINLFLGLLRPTPATCGSWADPSRRDRVRPVGAMLQTGGLPTAVEVGSSSSSRAASIRNRSPLDQILATAGLPTLVDRRVEVLSGGESQRLRFALAIAGDPDLLFLDEPTVAMDVESRRAFWADMREFAEEGRTVLFATHYLDEADSVADRIVVLDHGRIVADGTAARSRPTSSRGRSASRCRIRRDGSARLPGVTDVTIHGADVTLTTSRRRRDDPRPLQGRPADPRPRRHRRRPGGRVRRPHHARAPA